MYYYGTGWADGRTDGAWHQMHARRARAVRGAHGVIPGHDQAGSGIHKTFSNLKKLESERLSPYVDLALQLRPTSWEGRVGGGAAGEERSGR